MFGDLIDLDKCFSNDLAGWAEVGPVQVAFAADVKLSNVQGYIEDSGEGRWTVHQAIENGVSAPVITLSLMHRFSSQNDNPFSNRVVAALRREFGGHKVIPSDKKQKG